MITVAARIRDVSKSGLRIACDVQLGRGVQVRVKLEKLTVFGEVCYCRWENGLYESGIKTADVICQYGLGRHLRGDQIDLFLPGRHLPERLSSKIHLQQRAPDAQEIASTRASFGCLNPCDERCRFFPEQGNCLLGSQHRQDWNCEVCRAIERWKAEARTLLLVREILNHTGLYLQPLDSLENIPRNQRSAYLMQVRLQNSPSRNIRLIIQTILESAEQTWIEQSDRSIRVK